MDTGSCDSGIEPAQVAAPLCTQNPPAVETSTSRATVELPEDILDAIVLRTGWREYFRLWRLVCRRYEKIDWFLRRRFVTVVPDTHSSLNSAISNASTIDGEKLVLVRPGVYLESVRMTREVTLVGLGSRNKVVIQAVGWEPALVWGGFGVGVTALRGVAYDAAEGGGAASVHQLTLCTRNQQQTTVVYIVAGEPVLSHCTVYGTAVVAGRCTAPYISHCHFRDSRSHGLHCVDHAGGTIARSNFTKNRGCGIRMSRGASPILAENCYLENGLDGAGYVAGDASPILERGDADDVILLSDAEEDEYFEAE
mmetsp:Transcript_22518/g.49171  ORF Transcript_22518/g.49171 Transcript_22518/m.49171 type:complete len:310 (-) Transcript_22518:152-1081(-)